MFEETNYNEIQKNIFDEKINSQNEKKSDLNTGIMDLKWKISRMRGQLGHYAEEIKYYENLDNLNKINEEREEEVDLRVNDETDKNEKIEDNDEYIILKMISEILKECEDDSAKKDPEIKSDEVYHNFKTVCVIFLEMDSDNRFTRKYQTFRITSDTTIKTLQETVQVFWDIKETDSESHFFFADDEKLHKMTEEQKKFSLEKLIKNHMPSLKVPTFVISSNDKAKIDDVFEKKEPKKQQNVELNVKESVESKVVDRFFRYFVGMSKIIKSRIDDKDPNKVPDEMKKPTCASATLSIVKDVFLVLILAMTIFALNTLRPSKEAFYSHTAYKNQFKKYTSMNYLTTKELNESILAMLSDLFNDSPKSMAQNNHNMQINSLRYSVYKTKAKECALVTTRNCSETLYDESTADPLEASPFLSSRSYEAQIKSEIESVFNSSSGDPQEKYFVLSRLLLDNFLKKEENLLLYLEDLFTPVTWANLLSINYSGKYGVYTGKPNVDIFISPGFVSSSIMEIALTAINSDPMFNPQVSRAITIDYALYNSNCDSYFYFFIIYEITPIGGILAPKVTITPFDINVYTKQSGDILRIIDVVRLIFVIFLFIYGIYEYFNGKDQEKNKTLSTYIIRFFELKNLTTFLLFIFYLLKFSVKLGKLNGSLPKIRDNKDYAYMPIYEYYSVIDAYDWAILLESLIVILMFIRLVLLFSQIKRLKILFRYLNRSFLNVAVYFGILLFIMFSNSVLANNIWGQDYDEYRNLGNSFTNSLLFSIGHFHVKIFNSRYGFWNILFTLQFFMIYVYFATSAFPGFFLEAYRINSTLDGYSYDVRMLKADIEEDLRINGKKKRRVPKQN